MQLRDPMAGHGKGLGSQLGEELRRPELARLRVRVGADVVLGQEGGFERLGEGGEGGAGVGELGGAACVWGWEDGGAEEAVGGAAGVVARVAVEEAVTLCGVC